METITKKELRELFESNYCYKYENDKEFVDAAEHEYEIDIEDGSTIFSGGDEPFIVIDW